MVLSIALPRGGPIVLGAALGVLVIFVLALIERVERAVMRLEKELKELRGRIGPLPKAVGRPLRSLALTARPLVLPLLAALVVGTFELAQAIQVIAGAGFIVIAWYVIVAPEKRSLKRMEQETEKRVKSWWTLAWKHGWWLLLLALLLLPGWLLTRSAADYFETIGGVAAFLLVVACAMWLAALLLRLIGQSTSYLHIALAAVLGVGVLRLGMAGGLIPGDRLVRDATWVPGLLVAIAAALIGLDMALGALHVLVPHPRPGWLGTVLAAMVELAAKRWGSDTPPRLPKQLRRLQAVAERKKLRPLQFARESGLAAALGATVMLLFCAVYGLAATARLGDNLAKPGVRAGNAAVPVPSTDDRALADAYSPVLALTADERWSPISVESYLQHARLGNASTAVGDLSSLPTSCPAGAKAPCYRLNIGCAAGRDPCSGGELGPAMESRPRSAAVHVPHAGATYVRVLRKDRPLSDGSPDPFAGWSATDQRLAGLTTLVQYWYFYYYDEWVAPAFAGVLTQRHESDWEAVTVGLSSTRPLFVAYSEHCSGTWVWWPQSEVSNSPEVVGRTHVLVAVARGSHANYPEADQERSPDWTHCQGLPRGVTTLVSYASNIRDKTEYAWLWHQPQQGLILVNAKTPPMNFPGSWGGHDETVLDNFNANQIAVNGPGPLTPPLQELWRRPLQKIFCRYDHPADYIEQGCPAG